MAKNKDVVKKIMLGGSVLTVALLTGAVAFGSYIASDIIKFNKLLENPNIYENIYIGDLDVSNMDKELTKTLLAQEIEKDKIILTYKDSQFEFSKKDIGISYYIDEAVESAYNIARLGTASENRQEIKNLQEFQTTISLEMDYAESEILTNIEQIAEGINIEPKEPILTKNQEGFSVETGNIGLKVDVEATYLDILDSIHQDGTTYVEITVIETNPENDYKELEKIQSVLGTFSTSFSNSSANRVHNVQLSASGVNGTILQPGEVFSTSEAFLPRTSANGYKSAATIMDGEFIDGIGGGICQVSSTLYNAILFAELEVVERQSHSLKVGYLDYGYDAVISGDYLDLKFRNSSDAPIYIEAYTEGTQIICTIYGEETRPSNRTLKFQSTLTETVQPSPENVTKTDTLPEGQRKVVTSAANGYKYSLYKLIYVDNVLQDKVFVSSSYYRPKQGSVLVGTGKVVQSENTENTQDTGNTENVDVSTSDDTVEEVPDSVIVDSTPSTEESTDGDTGGDTEVYEPQIITPVVTVSDVTIPEISEPEDVYDASEGMEEDE